MIDLTPLDVRKKRGDFKKTMRGYETQEVDTFLDLVAERMEELVRETLALRERSAGLQAQVDAQGGREKAVQDALVTAQSLRDEIKEQARREAEVILREAEMQARRVVADAEARLHEQRAALEELERHRERFLMALRRLLERGMDVVSVEQGRVLGGPQVDLDHPPPPSRRAEPAAPRGPAASLDEAARRGAGPVKGDLWLGLTDEPPADHDPEPAR